MHYGRLINDWDVLECSIKGPKAELGTQRNPCVLEAS
jgi:hypothetical protein